MKVVWAQRGDFLIAEPSCADGAQGKLSATIVHILFPEQVKHLRTLSCWPSAFDTLVARDPEGCAASSEEHANPHEQGDKSESEDSDLFENTNRVHYDSFEDDNEDEEEDEEEDEADGENHG